MFKETNFQIWVFGSLEIYVKKYLVEIRMLKNITDSQLMIAAN